MHKKMTRVLFLGVVFLSLGAIACQKLETGRSVPFPATFPAPKVLAPLSLEYGELVAVTASADDPYWNVLWFQKPDKSIVIVAVNTSQSIVHVRGTIPRK